MKKLVADVLHERSDRRAAELIERSAEDFGGGKRAAMVLHETFEAASLALKALMLCFLTRLMQVTYREKARIEREYVPEGYRHMFTPQEWDQEGVRAVTEIFLEHTFGST